MHQDKREILPRVPADKYLHQCAAILHADKGGPDSLPYPTTYLHIDIRVSKKITPNKLNAEIAFNDIFVASRRKRNGNDSRELSPEGTYTSNAVHNKIGAKVSRKKCRISYKKLQKRILQCRL